MLLLETSWRDMFLVSLAQSNVTVDWSQALVDVAAAAAGRPWMMSADMTTLSSHASQVSDLVQRLRHMELDVTEYTCLKALLLFRPGQSVAYDSCHCVSIIQDLRGQRSLNMQA